MMTTGKAVRVIQRGGGDPSDRKPNKQVKREMRRVEGNSRPTVALLLGGVPP